MPRPTKPILSRRGIAQEALRLVEEEGIEGLTTRKLAKRLGVEGPSLYNHVANRDDLLDAMTGLIDEYVDRPCSTTRTGAPGSPSSLAPTGAHSPSSRSSSR